MPPARVIEPEHDRSLPWLRDETRDFWTGGASGELLIPWCDSCERWVLPLAATCPTCDAGLESRPVSGRATVFTFTINHQPFNPEIPVPYPVAVVTLDEQDDLRLVTNLVGVEADAISIGMPVQVLFERHGDIHVPLFEPAT